MSATTEPQTGRMGERFGHGACVLCGANNRDGAQVLVWAQATFCETKESPKGAS